MDIESLIAQQVASVQAAVGGVEEVAAPQASWEVAAPQADDNLIVGAGSFCADHGKYGFIQQDSGEENMFVMPGGCEAFGFALPALGSRVIYTIVPDPKTGRPRAEGVQPDPAGQAFGGPSAEEMSALGMKTGTMKTDNGKFGFIEQDEKGEDNMFVLPKSCQAFGGYLPPCGTRVSYEVVLDEKSGKPRAENVQNLGGAAPPQDFDKGQGKKRKRDDSGRQSGTIIKEGAKFGFIEQDSGEENMFVMPSSCGAFGLGVLVMPPIGTRVTYTVMLDSTSGRNRAENVEPELDSWGNPKGGKGGKGGKGSGMWVEVPQSPSWGGGDDWGKGKDNSWGKGDSWGKGKGDDWGKGDSWYGAAPSKGPAFHGHGGFDPSKLGGIILPSMKGAAMKGGNGWDSDWESGGKGGKQEETWYNETGVIVPAMASKGGKGKKKGYGSAPPVAPGRKGGIFLADHGKFGFIQQDSGEDNMFVMPFGCEAFGGVFPEKGSRVSYEVVVDPKTGKLRAHDVQPENERFTGSLFTDTGKFGFILQDSGADNMFVMPGAFEEGVLPPVGTKVSYSVVLDKKSQRPRAEGCLVMSEIDELQQEMEEIDGLLGNIEAGSVAPPDLS